MHSKSVEQLVQLFDSFWFCFDVLLTSFAHLYQAEGSNDSSCAGAIRTDEIGAGRR